MAFAKSYIPYGIYWSSPFCRWQGSFAGRHALKLAAEVARQALAARRLPPDAFDGIVLGTTVPQQGAFYGAPWVAALIGAPSLGGPTMSQACSTGVRTLVTAAAEIELGEREAVLVVCADRTSNGPHLYYPNPLGPGGTGDKEDWVLDNFGHDPWARVSMIETAENVAARIGVTRAELDEVSLLRYAQYQDALKDGAAFHRRFMVAPLEVKDEAGRKTLATVTGDEGVFPTTRDGLAKLKPVREGGLITYGMQTHPADGCSGIAVTTRDRAAALRRDERVEIKILSSAQTRAEKGYMALAPAPAAKVALERAGLAPADLAAVKTHNPFAVNDVVVSRELGLAPDALNRYGSPLIYGHPQAPTAARAVIELIEELVERGGGSGLFTGCAAGDTAMALCLRVDVR